MIRLKRFFSALLSLSIILVAPGLAPYQAAAQTVSAARVVIPSVQLGAAGASIHGLGGSATVLPAANLQTGLIPSLSPTATLAPVLSAPAAVTAAAVVRPTAIAAMQASALPAAAKAEKSGVAPTRAFAALKTGGHALTAAAQSDAVAAPRVALDGLFEGSIARPEALAVSALPSASAPSHLDPSSSRKPSQGPRWVKTLKGPDAGARTSLKRTLSVGYLGAVIPIAITMGTVIIAQLLGYELHPNYQGPVGDALPTLLQSLAIWVGAAVMAPVSEEAIFRGGLQGGLAKLTKLLHLGNFVVPALITSVIFVALHETSDPVLFATRMVHALILSYVYHKEGVLASMAAHGFFNGLLALSIVLSAAGLPWLGLAVAPLALYFAYRARKVLKAQKPDIGSGALTPKPLSGLLSILLAAVLLLGYFTIMPNIFWPIGAALLFIHGMMKLKQK